MNIGTERRPFKVLRPIEHSAAMVIARYSNRYPAAMINTQTQPLQSDLLWKSLRVGIICATCAFAFLFFSQRNFLKQNGQALGALTSNIQRVPFATITKSAAPPADAKALTIAPTSVVPNAGINVGATTPPAFSIPQLDGFKVTEFALLVSPEFQHLGGIQLRLSSVNAGAGTYDITVRTRGREFYRQDVRINERVPVTRNPGTGPALVVGGLAPNRVFGYLTEPERGRHGHRRRHRRK
jgi:hypothetical protein